jgi:hypothetical protein
VTTRQSLRDRLAEEGFDVGSWSEPSYSKAIEIDEALAVFAEWLRNQAAELREIAAADTDEDRQRIRHFIAAYESLADSISPQGEQDHERN